MKKVLVNFIQDRSGSMQSVWDETLNGFKKFIEDLRDSAKKDDIEYLFSLTTFDTQIDTPIVAKPINDVNLNELQKHGPRGSTALYDAVGITITNTEKDRHGAEKIICVVVTDGQENSSREWTKDKLNQAIEAKLNAGDWTFTYLGTQPETWDDATSIGVGVGATATYTPTMAAAAYACTANAVASFSASSARGTRSLLHSYSTPQRMSAAGMKTKPSKPTPSRPTPGTTPRRPTTTSSSTRRWR